MLSSKTAKSAAAAAILALAATGVAAAAGALPGQAEPGLTKASDNAGFTVPQSDNEHRADPDEASDGAVTAAEEDVTVQSEHGSSVSDFARTTELTGADKGAAIADLASDGRSSARGESGAAGEAGEDGAANANASSRRP